MASACINTIGLSPENSPYGWFSHHRLSDQPDPVKNVSDLKTESDTTTFDGFQFILEDPETMLPADELFSDGKLVPRVPMQFSVNPPEVATSTTTILSGDDSRRNIDESDPYLYSPRAPRCSSRWKELLGFKKLNQSVKSDHRRTTSFPSSNTTGTARSIRQLLYGNSKTSLDSSIKLPLLNNNADNESASVSSSRSSRPSISSSSSSSGHDIDELPRLSLDSDKKLSVNHPKTRLSKTKTQQSNDLRSTTRVGRTRRRTTDATLATAATNRCLSVDSPRINSCGKIVFHNSLERSSSSPSSLIGGSRLKHRGMERSYSGNVRVTPVLNVPVCKSGGMFGFQMFGSSSSSNNGGLNRSQRFNGKSRPDC